MSSEIGQKYTYTNESFSGCDMVATILMPKTTGGNVAYAIGEMQTISYSIHMDRRPVRNIGNINVKDYVMGPRTIAGSLVFAVFNKHFANKIMEDIKDTSGPGYSFLVDEFPPFDIIISAANEYGLRSRMVIYGVRLVNEGQVMSVNDVYTENTYQFVATDIEYLTDEVSYVSGSSKRGASYKIVDNQLGVFDNAFKYDYKDSVRPKGFDIELRYKVKQHVSNNRDGVVDFWITPVKRTGILHINNDNVGLSLHVADVVNGNNRIPVQLKAGDYQAHWVDGEEKSNTVAFKIMEKIVEEAPVMPAPLIEAVSDDAIRIVSNSREHTRALYRDGDDNEFSVKLTGKRALLKNLKGDTEYFICTCTENLLIRSDEVVVTTLSYGYDQYNDFADYIRYNSSALINGDINVYIKVITDSKRISESGVKYETLADTIIEACNQYSKQLSDLDMNDFEDIVQYQKEVDRLLALIDASKELVSIAITINNDSVYGYNYDTFVVEAPQLEDSITSKTSFIVKDNIQAMDFFRQYSKAKQFDKTIENRHFVIDGDTTRCNFNGREATRHYTYAINKYGFKSPKVDFYVSSNDEKVNEIEKNILENDRANYITEKVKSMVSHKLSNYDDIDHENLYIEIAKTPDTKMVKPPKVYSVTDKTLTLLVEENLQELKSIGALVVISEISTSIKKRTRYKVPVQDKMIINNIKHGLRSGETYLVWIEDGEQNIISDSQSITISGYEMIPTNEQFFINNSLDCINNELRENGLNSIIIDNILNKYRFNNISNKFNIYENILKDIIEERSGIEDLSNTLFHTCKVRNNQLYSVSERFFETMPMKEGNRLYIPRECVAEIMTIAGNDMETKIEKIKAGSYIDLPISSESYTVYSFHDNELKGRSGVIFVNDYKGSLRTDRLNVEVKE